MDSARFDRWTKLFARRMSRRTAATGLGAVTVAALASPADARVSQTDDVGLEVCLDITSCKRYRCTSAVNPDGSGDCSYYTVGDIPGGPYEQEWVWGNLPKPCTPKNKTIRELEALCNQAYPGNEDPRACNNDCAACTSFSLPGIWCH